MTLGRHPTSWCACGPVPPRWHWTSSLGSSRTAPLCKWMLLCLSFLLLCLQASWYRWLLPSRQSSTLAWYMICPVLPDVCFTACLFTFPGQCKRWLLFIRSKCLISFWILLCMLMPYFIWAKTSAFGFIMCTWFLVLTFEHSKLIPETMVITEYHVHLL